MLESRRRRGLNPRTLSRTLVSTGLWGAVLVAVGLALLGAGYSPGQVLAYLVAWLLGSTFPGVLLWRAMARRTTLVRELGFGSVLGISLQLLVWAVGTAVGHPRIMMVVLPVAVALVFVLTPGLRRHWWPERSDRLSTPLGWHLAMVVVALFSIYRFFRLSMMQRPLPPQPIEVSRDLWYASAISSELTRTLRPQDPFVAGEALKYHWFADAHVTATAQLSGLSVVDAMMNAWQLCILVVLLLVVAASVEHFLDGPQLTGPDGAPLSDIRRWWAGPLAATFTFAITAMWRFGNPGIQRVGNGFVPSSPSGTLGLLVLLGLTGPVLDMLRGRSRRGTWVTLVLLLLLASGTKPSLLPVVGFGSLVVVIVDLLRTRQLHRPMAVVFVLSLVIAAVTAPVLAGSTGGSRLQLFGLMVVDPSYRLLYGGKLVLPAAGGWLLPALADGIPHAVPIVAMLLGIWLLAEVPRLLALAGLLTMPLRQDPGVLWAAGVGAGGYAAMWVIAHPGFSQHYFWTETNALMVVLSVTNAVRLIPASRRARTLLLPAVAVAVPLVIAAHHTMVLPKVDLRASLSEVVTGRVHPYLVIMEGLAVALLLALVIRALFRRISLPLLTTLTICALAAALPAPLTQLQTATSPEPGPLPKVGVAYQYVSPEQQEAALWLGSHSPRDSVVATNMFCWPMGQDSPRCAVNAMWLSAISGRRTFLSDWSYSVASTSQYDGTVPMNALPTAVEAPTAKVLRQLRSQQDTTWIFADERASRISPKLKRLADLRYRSEHIAIYQLHDSYAP
jgi:hypothetical protein